MYYVYVLFSKKDGMFYSGFTPVNPFSRFEKHQKQLAPATKYRLPLKLIYFEGHTSRADALKRERYFKTTKGRTTLKQMLKTALNQT